MTFEELLDQAIALLRRRGRLTHRALKRQFDLDDNYLEDLKAELIQGQRLAVDEDGEVLVWIGGTDVSPTTIPRAVQSAPPDPFTPLEAERRQLTVMFCDLVGSTILSAQLDPEDLREVVRAYQATCAEVIQRFDGHIAQYLGDGLLVYFGYPQAHEDDAQRAVRTGVGIVEALATLNRRLGQQQGVHLAVRVGIHTGLVVVGEMGGGGRQEQLALGETPNIAARIQGLAVPDTVLISAATQRLIQGYFTCHERGVQTLKGVATPLEVHQVVRVTEAQHRLDVAVARGLTPLVGREHEVGLLRDRWAQIEAGRGHIMMLSGEAGIGKSRLVQVVKDEIIDATALRIECRCLLYHQHSPLYPIIAHLERALALRQDEMPKDRLRKLEDALRPSSLPLADVMPLFAELLAVPLSASYARLTLTPQQQRQKTLEALLTWLLALTEHQPVLLVVEDLHWIDPSTLEFLTLLVEQGPRARLLTLLTCRPEFQAPWGWRTHLTPVTLQRLPQPQVEAMIAQVTGGKALPPAVLQHVVTKTDGVPLFVEELTKTVLESGLLRETQEHYELTGPLPPLAIPATLHDSLMARLDRLATAKAVAQLGAVLGRTFSYEVLQAVSPLDAAALQQAFARLVEAELLYQQGLPPQVTYVFKHALIQETAYQSLLKSTRQQYHQRIAQVLEARFPDLVDTQPELLAQHYTEAGQSARAIAHWRWAGEHALQRAATLEAISHLRRGLAVLATLPETDERTQQELGLQITLGAALTAARGYAASEVETAYTRAYELGQHIGDTPQLLPVLWGLWFFAMGRAEYGRAQALGESLMQVGQRVQDSTVLMAGHTALGTTFLFQGALAQAHLHLEQSVSLYNLQQHRTLALVYGMDYGMVGRAWLGWQRLVQGYPSQGLQHSEEALRLAQEVAHPYNLSSILPDIIVALLSRREIQRTQEQAEALIALATERGFTLRVAYGEIFQGWALVMQGATDGGLARMRQALSAIRTLGVALAQSWFLGLFAEACAYTGQSEEGLHALEEALAHMDKTGEHIWEAELHRLKGELLGRHTTMQATEAETCFQQALVVARGQGAKWLELRAAMSLARLWQYQGKRTEAYELLAPVYGWFTEGFDTADLQEAKAQLEALAERDAGGHALPHLQCWMYMFLTS